MSLLNVLDRLWYFTKYKVGKHCSIKKIGILVIIFFVWYLFFNNSSSPKREFEATKKVCLLFLLVY